MINDGRQICADASAADFLTGPVIMLTFPLAVMVITGVCMIFQWWFEYLRHASQDALDDTVYERRCSINCTRYAAP